MIKVSNLSFKYDNKIILDDISLILKPNLIYGLIGSNGAGKTTLLNTLCTLNKPNTGKVTYYSEDIFESVKYLNDTIFLLEDEYVGLYTIKSFVHNLKVIRCQKPNKEILSILVKAFKLDNNVHIRKFSKGMKKLAIFTVYMAFEPNVIFMDEFLDGVDVVNRKIIKDYLLEYIKQPNKIIIISSHQSEDINDLCNEIILLDNHKVKVAMPFNDFKNNYVTYRIQLETTMARHNFEVIGLILKDFKVVDGDMHYLSFENTEQNIKLVKRIKSINTKQIEVALREVIYNEF